MSLVDFGNILKFFGGTEPSPEEQKVLFKEAALMALARATSADTNIKQVELEHVQGLLLEATGEEFSLGDIRTAAKSEVFESQPLEKYLAGVARKLANNDRIKLIELTGRVIHSDDRVSQMEIDYFNKVADALNATPAEVLGLIADDD
ncbi:MAG: TerB family tellurite resistance protein [Pseudomonadota bacterium]